MSIYLGNQLVAGNSDGGVPTGTILPYGGSTAPNGFLLCDGSAVSRTTYAALYAVIGDVYGAGDGNSTFNLPVLNNIVTNVNTNVPVKGNGMTLGLTDGTTNGGMVTVNTNYPSFNAIAGNYGKSVGAKNASGTHMQLSKTVGITTDPTKSGIVGTLTRTQVNCNYIIKY